MKKLLILLLAMSSTAAFAYDKTGTSNGGYGMAGCGLGSIIFKDNDKTQILAGTTNGTFGTQTFGITFGTSNCGPNGMLFSKTQVQNYIAANQPALQNDIARGDGETLNGLAEIMGHKNSSEFNAALKANYAHIFAKADLTPAQITDNLFQVLN